MNNALSASQSLARLCPTSQVRLDKVAHLIKERGHAIVWAMNYEERQGNLPSCTQIVDGLQMDLGIKVGRTSAYRALLAIRSDNAKHNASQQSA